MTAITSSESASGFNPASSVRVMRSMRLGALLVLGGLALAGATSCSKRSNEVVVYTSVDQVFSEPVFRAFEKATGTSVRGVFDTEETKSTGVLNRLVAEAKQPQADVFWSGDPVRPFVLSKRGLVEAYISPSAADLPDGLRAADGTWTGFAARARVLLVNKTRVPSGAAPRSVRDLSNPRWRGQTTMASPLFGTTTMHVAALFVAWGDAAARSFLDDLKKNDVRIASSNGEVKRLVAAGEVAFGLTDTDDANEALKSGAPVEVVYPDQDGIGTLVIPTSVVLIRGRPHGETAKRLVDYLLSAEVERQLAEAAAHMPLRAGVPKPAGVRDLTELRAMSVDYARVAAEMERIQSWLKQWAGL